MFAGETTALDNHVLVLNKHYAAVRVVGARRALTFLVRGTADVVLYENEQYWNVDRRADCPLPTRPRLGLLERHEHNFD